MSVPRLFSVFLFSLCELWPKAAASRGESSKGALPLASLWMSVKGQRVKMYLGSCLSLPVHSLNALFKAA